MAEDPVILPHANTQAVAPNSPPPDSPAPDSPAPGGTAQDTGRLANLVVAKLKILELLVQLARRQLGLVRDGDLSDLMKLLSAKQTVLGQLQTIERELDPYRRQDPEGRQWPSAAERLRCQQHARECDELVGEAMRLEKLGESEMLRRRDAAAAVLQGVSTAVDVHAAYAGSTAALPLPLHLHCEG